MSGDLWHARNAALAAIDLDCIVLCGTSFALRKKQARIETGEFVRLYEIRLERHLHFAWLMISNSGLAGESSVAADEQRRYKKLTMQLPLLSFVIGPFVGNLILCCLAVLFPTWFLNIDIFEAFKTDFVLIAIGIGYSLSEEMPVALVTCLAFLFLGLSGVRTKSFRIFKSLICFAYLAISACAFSTLYVEKLFPFEHDTLYYSKIYPILQVNLITITCFLVFVLFVAKL